MTTTTFSFTGAEQEFVVPDGVTSLDIDCQGAEGGDEYTGLPPTGLGGRTQCTLTVTPGETLEIRVGGEGTPGSSGVTAPGGYNGGGTGGRGAGGGGGASDVRQGGVALADRVVIAGGGGGAGANNGAGNGGGGNGGGGNGTTGVNGVSGPTGGGGATTGAGGTAGTGASNGTAGALGVGGTGGNNSDPRGGGGGGGGNYGGGGGGSSGVGTAGGGGGGGSGLDTGSGVTLTAGYRSGDGQVLITYTIPPPANDDWADAEDLGSSLGATADGSNYGATVEGSEPVASAGPAAAHASVWWKWECPAGPDRLMALTTLGSRERLSPLTPLDTVLAVYTGASLAGLSEEASNDDGDADTTSSLMFTATAGTVYYFQVGGQTDADVGDIHLVLYMTAADIDFAAVPFTAGQGFIEITDPDAAPPADRLAIQVLDPDDDDDPLGVLGLTAARQFLDEAHGNGSFSFRLQNRVADNTDPSYSPMVAHPSLSLAQRRRFYRFILDGDAVFTGYAEGRRRRLVSPSKDADQFTVIAGRRWEAWLDKAWVQPPNMVDFEPSVPYNKARRFNYTDPRYDDSDWLFPIEVARQDSMTVAWTGLPPAWPDPEAYWIGRPGMVHNPGVGVFGASTDYYRAALISVDNDEEHLVYAGADDTVQFFLDGAKLIDVAFGNVAQQGWASTGYYRLHKWQGRVSAGLHTLAAAVSNLAWPPINPTALVATMIRAEGLDEVVFNTAANGFWRVLPDAPYEPGMTPGHVIEALKLEANNRGILDEWELGFDRYVDSNGNPWPEVNDIVLTVGEPYTQALKRLNEAFCDLRPSRGGFLLDAYVKGTAGKTVAVGFQDSPANLSNIVELDVAETNERGNVVLFIWKNGSFAVTQTGFAPGDPTDAGRIEDYLEMGQVDTLVAAQTLAAEYALIALAVPTTYSLGIEPRSDDDTPYKDGVEPWDTVPIEAADGAVDTDERVASVRYSQDDATKKIDWKVELRDKYADRLDRFQTLLERTTPGGGGSTSNATAVSRDDPFPFVSGVQFVSFGLMQGFTGDEMGPHPAPMKGTARELILRRKAADVSGDVSVDLYITDVLVGSCSMASGDQLGKANIDPPVAMAAQLDDLLVVITEGNNAPLVAMVAIELAS